MVAFSGGLDSTVLLHLFRFRAGVKHLLAAHFDHAVRPASRADAAWARGLARAWSIPVVSGRATDPPGNETAARRQRWEFLRASAAGAGCTLVATAHHADDQAETVLFRVLRGTGIHGLTGIAASSAGGIVRPLLPFWRRELEEYAAARGLAWREDPTNRAGGNARSRMRAELIPWVEEHLAPRARNSLVNLAAVAAGERAALRELLGPVADQVVRQEGDDVLIARDALRACGAPVAALLVRDALGRCGATLSRAGTENFLQFTTRARSGARRHLPGGLRATAEFGQVRLHRPPEPKLGRPLVWDPFAGAAGHGALEWELAGRRLRVHWERRAGAVATNPLQAGETAIFALPGLVPPLTLRGWLHGDRVSTAGGTKRLKKLFVEWRVPRSQRSRVPILADGTGRVLWVAGIQQAAGTEPGTGAEGHLFLRVADD